MSCRQFLFSFLILTFLMAASCTRNPQRAVERLAILPIENLTGDADLEWMGRAMTSVIAYDLTGVKDIAPQTVDSIVSAYGGQATRVLEAYLVSRNGKLEVRAAIEDLTERKSVANFTLDGAMSDGPLRLANDLAKRISASARPYATNNAEAFHAYGAARTATDLFDAGRFLQMATAADPRFSAAYIDWAATYLGQGQRDKALQVIEIARQQRFDPIDQAQMDLFASTITGDKSVQVQALEKLAKLTPADLKVLKDLAQLQFVQRKFTDAVHTYETAAQVDPEDSSVWNELGYAYVQVHDLAKARSALEHYQQLSPPAEINPLDSLGEVSFYLGDFAGAEKYFTQAQQKNPAAGGGELLKAAEAKLMQDDLRGADALFERYLGTASEAQKKQAGYQRAEWSFLTGRRRTGMDQMGKLIPGLEGDLKSLALCQLALWKLQTGDSKASSDLAEQASGAAASAQLRNVSQMFRAIVSRGAVKSGAPLADAIGLLMTRNAGDAVPLLEELYKAAHPSLDGQVRTLLAAAYLQSSPPKDAAKLVELYPIPLSSGDQLFASLTFPRFLFLRGLVRVSQGKKDEAKQNFALYLKYAGDVPDVFGDAEAARKFVGQ